MVRTEPEGRPEAQIGDDEIDLRELFRTLWTGRWTIALVTAAFVALAVIYLHVATYRYTAELVLTPTQSSNTSRLGGLGGLASLAGVSLPQDQKEMSFSLYQQGVHSRGLADALARHKPLMRVVFANEWNVDAGRWQQPRGAMSSMVGALKNILGVPVYEWRTPDGARLQTYLKREVGVAEDMKKPFVTLTFDHKDPEFAVYFLNTLNVELDNILRQKALERATSNIAYLSEQLSRVTITEHRAAIAESLSEQEKQKMAASSSAPFAADPFGTASASLRPTSPRPPLVLIMSLIGGVMLGSLVVLTLGYAFDRSPDFRKRAPRRLFGRTEDDDNFNVG